MYDLYVPSVEALSVHHEALNTAHGYSHPHSNLNEGFMSVAESLSNHHIALNAAHGYS